MKAYLVTKFDVNMLEEYPAQILVDEVDKDEFCLDLEFEQEEDSLVNTITNSVLLREIKALCGLELKKGEFIIPKLSKYDKAFVIQKGINKTRFFKVIIES